MSEDVKKIAEELVIVCKGTYTKDIQTGSDGDMSTRVPEKDLMIMKASGSSLTDNTPDGFVITDLDGNLVEGEGKPIREALLHGLLYRIYPKVNAAVHTRSPYSIAWASTGEALKRATWHTQLKMSVGLPSLDVPAVMVKKGYFPVMEDIYREDLDLPGLLLIDHGLVAVGKNAVNVEHTAELIEEIAQVAILKMTVPKLGL